MKNRLYPILGVAGLAGLLIACAVTTFSMKANRLTVISPNQGVLGDKPYLGSIQFRSTFGVAGSTAVTTNTTLTVLNNHMKSGDSVAIPDSIGLNDFGSISVITKADVVERNYHPSIMGVIYVAMEKDIVGEDQVRAALNQRAADLQSLLTQFVEPGAWYNGLGLGLALQNVSAGLKGQTGGCGLFDTRLCHWFTGWIGDDVIGQGMAIFVNIDNSYFTEISGTLSALSDAWPQCSDTNTPICPVQNGTYTIDLNAPGDGHYALQATSAVVNN